MSLAILFHFLWAQHVSDINISIIRSLRLCCWITTSVVLFSVRCVLEIWCGWFWVVPVLLAEACKMNTTQTQPHQISNTQRTENKTTDVVIQQHSRKLLMMDILMSETCWAHKKWNKIASDIKLVFHSSTIHNCPLNGYPTFLLDLKQSATCRSLSLSVLLNHNRGSPPCLPFRVPSLFPNFLCQILLKFLLGVGFEVLTAVVLRIQVDTVSWG